MSEFNIDSANIDVERIMKEIRTRITEKRGEDYTEEQIQEMANVKLERFLDPKNVRSGMAELYRKRLKEKQLVLQRSAQTPLFEFDADDIYRSSRGLTGRTIYLVRKLLNPFLKLFFNPAPIVHALTVQKQLNEVFSQMIKTQEEFIEIAALNYEVMNNLVVEMTRLSIDMKNHRMRVESVAGRLDFNERRARALEKVVQYREGSLVPGSGDSDNAPEKRKRRRRRGRRRPTGAAQTTGPTEALENSSGTDSPVKSTESPSAESKESESAKKPLASQPASDNDRQSGLTTSDKGSSPPTETGVGTSPETGGDSAERTSSSSGNSGSSEQ